MASCHQTFKKNIWLQEVIEQKQRAELAASEVIIAGLKEEIGDYERRLSTAEADTEALRQQVADKDRQIAEVEAQARWMHSTCCVTVISVEVDAHVLTLHTVFLGHLDPVVRDTDPDPDPSITSKNSKENLDFHCFVTSFWLFICEEWCKCTLKKHLG